MNKHEWLRKISKDMHYYSKMNDLHEIAAYCQMIQVAFDNLPTPQFTPQVSLGQCDGISNVINLHTRMSKKPKQVG